MARATQRERVLAHSPRRQPVLIIGEQLPHVTGDRVTVRQVMVNLLANAVKYTRTRDVAVIEVWAAQDHDNVAIFGRDTGGRFDPRYGQKLFGVLQRLHHAHEFEGTGVGLANVWRIVERHDGHVTAEGRVDQRAMFGFTLPRTR